MTPLTPRWFILSLALILTQFLHFNSLVLSAKAQEPRDRQNLTKLWKSAETAATEFDFKLAVTQATAAMNDGFDWPYAHYKRGQWNFRAGDIPASLKDFDDFVQAVPRLANAQWERGITCYYAKQYKTGAKQFEDYQTFHNQDVENAVWRYLCQMKYDGKAKARAAMLPIESDSRIPMMQIYALFRGKATPQDVLNQVEASTAPPLPKRHQVFDAHLYLALFYDSEGELGKALKHVQVAVKQFDQGDYMWAVALEHEKHLLRQSKLNQETAPK